MKELIARLDELYAKATGGEWERDYDKHYDRMERLHYIEHFIMGGESRVVCASNFLDADERTPDSEGVHEDLQARKDLDFIAALHNAWPQIRDALEKMSGDAERYRCVFLAMVGRKWRHLPYEIAEHRPADDDEDDAALDDTLVAAIDSARRGGK